LRSFPCAGESVQTTKGGEGNIFLGEASVANGNQIGDPAVEIDIDHEKDLIAPLN
jgi:hypothetical protein